MAASWHHGNSIAAAVGGGGVGGGGGGSEISAVLLNRREAFEYLFIIYTTLQVFFPCSLRALWLVSTFLLLKSSQLFERRHRALNVSRPTTSIMVELTHTGDLIARVVNLLVVVLLAVV